MIYYVAFGMILSGAVFDGLDVFLDTSFETWQYVYSILRDVQMIGLSLLAFVLCSYKRIEIKAATFFLILWRVFVAALNLLGGPVYYSVIFVGALHLIYLAWIAKSLSMGRIGQEEPKDGAYVFLMPIHSVWGLLKSVFIPWEMARYESVVLVQGCMLWAVNGRRFVTRRIEDTNISEREGVRVYIGRNLSYSEIVRLAGLVGKRAIPGIRDCRRLRVKK